MFNKKIFDKIDELYPKYLDVWEDICNIESPTNFKEGVDEVGKYMVALAEEKGFEVEIFPQSDAGDVVIITLNPEAEKEAIVFSAHMDTVHPVGSFGYPAVKRDEENIYGPGVMDCKGGIVSAFLAMDALSACGYKDRPVRLMLQSDEETGSKTSNKETIKYICDKAKGAIAFFNLEGSVKNTAVLERKGILRYNFTLHGKALHSSRCFDAANAICEASYKIIELEKLKDENGITCNCGVISGGTVANTVAEECSFVADIRFATNEQFEEVKKLVKKIADEIHVEGCSCEVSEISYRPAMVYSRKNVELLEKMNEIYNECDLPILKGRLCLSGSDAAYVTEAGIPCVDNIGVEGKNIHSINEFAVLESLKLSAKQLASFTYCI